ncbi:alpha-1,2-fucosyltransferase [Fischerella sp. PCC 9605]|uniref:alpha-1,2-fucosyltransferase n=1 Tax=Fischerella sp. PCC 9605 TaxID=1173024 RepID=UPI0004BBD3ED|nr:alpha-1,2-fucosyltransferase [Fischerella sp. PCC 9605]
MIVIAKKTGQLGNRLFVFAHFIAFAIENNQTIINPAFDDYAEFFEITSGSICSCYPSNKLSFIFNNPIRKKIYTFIIFTYRFLNILEKQKIKTSVFKIVREGNKTNPFLLDTHDFLKLINNHDIVFADGYFFRCPSFFVKQADAIREYFTPIEQYRKNIDKLIESIRKDCELLIGVHIRHGDYKDYVGGAYFYTIQQYVQVMERIENLFPNQKIKFLICSNAEQDETLFSKFSYNLGTGNIVEDMYSLARCDYICGPPSSYSRWAAFYGGNIPLYIIRDPNASICLEDFKVYDIPLG